MAGDLTAGNENKQGKSGLPDRRGISRRTFLTAGGAALAVFALTACSKTTNKTTEMLPPPTSATPSTKTPKIETPIISTTTPVQVPAPAAARPPMGWNTWYGFKTDFNEAQIKAIAGIMVSSGMKEAGYEYINLDDGWMAKERDADGNMQGDPVKFPGGIKALADYLHGNGLKLGLYTSVGYHT